MWLIEHYNFKINNRESMMEMSNADTTMNQLDNYEYVRGMGAYRPHFEGVSESYFPLSKMEVFYNILIVVLTIIFVLGCMIGCIFWTLATGTEIFVIIWVSISLALLVIGVILLYVGGKDRRTLEKLMIEENNKKQMAMMGKKSKN